MLIWGQKTQPRKDTSDRNEIPKRYVLLICYISPRSSFLFLCSFLFFQPKFVLNQSPVSISFLILRFSWLLCKFGMSVFPEGKKVFFKKMQSLLLREDSRTYLLLGRSHKKEFWHATHPNQRRVWDAVKMKWWFEAIMNFFSQAGELAGRRIQFIATLFLFFLLRTGTQDSWKQSC